ncbi:plasmid transfer protein [Parabacteroides sp. PF5-9]|uniref:plasmid transfer protein n=1 Tax=Parabacteroides sp. PF5-9 TaxID=1742404 RepID=UPI0024771D6A|nr:plasmid transfer protein [Parabacteroides sp. PF5-9]MDH6358926.1 hypothetical protein [Parabacteroides sp. PF5-9]
MNELFDRQILNLFNGLWNKTMQDMGVFVLDAQALACIFMLLYFAIKAYPMMTGDKKLEIMPLLRPFALTLVIVFWGGVTSNGTKVDGVVTIINYPFNVITNTARGNFYDKLDKVDNLSRKRYAMIDSVAIKLTETSLEIERAEDENRNISDKILSWIGIDLEAVGKKIAGVWLLVQSKLKFLLVQLIERTVIIFFQFCVYVVFFLQIVFASVMVILGPLAFAMSVLPAFRDAWIHWVSRYISVCLYSAIGYIILGVACAMLEWGLEKEIMVLEKVLGNEAFFMMYVGFSSGDVAIFTVTALVGGFAMLTTPVVSTWIVQTSGVNQAVATMVGAAAMTVGKVGGAAAKKG